MAGKNNVEINIVELEVFRKLADLYKEEHPDWEEKVFGKKNKKVENAKEKIKSEKNAT